jgi:hypothetical protein
LGFFALPKSWYWRFSTFDIFYPESKSNTCPTLYKTWSWGRWLWNTCWASLLGI